MFFLFNFFFFSVKENHGPQNNQSMTSEIRMTLMKPDSLQGTPDKDLIAEFFAEEWRSAVASLSLTAEDVAALALVKEDPDKQEDAYSRLAGLVTQKRHAVVAGRAVALNARDVLERHAGHRKVVTAVLQALNNTSAQALGVMKDDFLEAIHLDALTACVPLVVKALDAFGFEDDQEEVEHGSPLCAVAAGGICFLSNCIGFLNPRYMGEHGTDIVCRIAERTIQAHPKDSLTAMCCVVFLACTARDAVTRGAEDVVRRLEPCASTIIRLWRLHRTCPHTARHAAELLGLLHTAGVLSAGDQADAQALTDSSSS